VTESGGEQETATPSRRGAEPRLRRASAGAPLLCGLLALFGVSACSPKAKPAEPELWYRFRFEASYRGQPVRFDQYVACGLRTIPGGSFGATPSVTTRGMYPLAVGRGMDDGSYIVVRIPDLCLRNRRYDVHTDDIRAGRRAEWASGGPFTLLPLVIWNDRRPDTGLVEAYVSQSYYARPDARLTAPKASVEFLPAGQRPPGAEQVLARADEPQYLPDPRSREERDRWKNGDWAHRPEDMAAFILLPLPDLEAQAKGQGLKPPVPAERQGQPGFIRYAPGGAASDAPPSAPAEFLQPETLADCLHRLQIGEPALSNLPPDPFDYQYYQTDDQRESDRRRAARARAAGEVWLTVSERRALKAERRRQCFERLGELRSFTLDGNGFEAAGAPPGALVFRRWGGRGVKDFPLLKSKGATSPDGYPLLRIEGDEVVMDDESLILKSKKSGSWYYVARIVSVFSDRVDG